MIQPINTNDLQESEDEKVEEVTIEIKEEDLENTTIIDEDITIQPKDLYPKEGAKFIIYQVTMFDIPNTKSFANYE